MDATTQVLVLRASQGDAEALESLLEKNLADLRAYVRLRAGPMIEGKESVADLVQSVCREVLEDLPGFEFRGEAAFRAWLFKHAFNKVVDRGRFYRAEKRDAGREVGAGEDQELDAILRGGALSSLTPSRVAMVHEDARRLDKAIAELPDEYREAVLLQRIAGLPYGEIATQMGKSEGAVRNLVYRGLARVAQSLGRGAE